MVTNSLDQKLKLWNAADAQVVAEHPLALGARYLALHPDGIHLAGPPPSNLVSVADPVLGDVSQSSANLALWNLSTGKVEKLFGGLRNWAMRLAFSHDGKKLAAATISDGVVVWSEKPHAPRRFRVEGDVIPVSIAFSPDDQVLFAGLRDGQVHAWNLENGEHLRRIICHGDEITQILFTPLGGRLITACRSNGTLRVWDWREGRRVGALDTSLTGVAALAWADPGRALIVGGVDGGIRYLRIAR